VPLRLIRSNRLVFMRDVLTNVDPALFRAGVGTRPL
jgi:hypothetical protein